MRTRLPAHRRPSATRSIGARERIDRTAYQLFSRHGIRAVGVDTLAARAGVAKMTLYKHYPSKDELALAALYVYWEPIGGVIWNAQDGVVRNGIIGLYLFGWLLLVRSNAFAF